jgi:phosphonate transport system permease protein
MRVKFNNCAKRILFDALFFTYFAALAIYVTFWSLNRFGLTALEPSQENAILHMSILAYATLALFCTFLLTARLLARGKIATIGGLLFTPKTTERLKSFWLWHVGATLLLTLTVSLQITDFSFAELADPEGLRGAGRLMDGLAHANLALLPTAIAQVVETIFIAFLATAIAVPLAFFIGFLSAKNIMTHPYAFAVYAAVRTLLNVIRSVEPLIWALIFTVWVGVGPFAGMLALMFHTVASLAKQYSEIVEDVSEGPLDGIRATGANTLQVIRFAIIPQVLLPYIAFTIYRWDTNVRMATVIGLVGGGGIGNLLIKYQGQAMWPEVGCIVLVIAAAVWLMDIASAYIREALR